jgi:hypothetical protein
LELTAKAGFIPEYCSFMNVWGLVGWFLNGNILKKKILPSNQLNYFNMLVPALKHIDRIFNGIAGISIIYVGKKP